MITFVNCSSQVLYDKEKNHNELLMLVNATVSHELRNPLFSVMA
jgi:signal transduction histidine kinase